MICHFKGFPEISLVLGYFFSFNVIFLILDESNGTTQEEKKPLEIDFVSAPNISVGFRLASYKQGIAYVQGWQISGFS